MIKKHQFVALICVLSLIFTTLFIPNVAAAELGDIDGNGISASDARLVLRYSVGLETLSAEQIKNANVDNDNKISSSDARLILRVSVGLDTFPHDIEYSCEIVEFNKFINKLKNDPDKINRFSNFSMNETEIKAPEYSKDPMGLIFRTIFNKELSKEVKKEISYSENFTKNRLITTENFPVLGEKYISDLTTDDIQDIKITKETGIDFISSLSSYDTPNKKHVDLANFKASAPKGDFYKITITLKEDNYDLNSPSNVDSAIDRIYMKDYHKHLNSLLTGLDLQDLNGLITMDNKIKTLCNVVFYIDAEKLEPAAAVYNVSMDTINQINAFFSISNNNNINASKKPTGYMRLNASNIVHDYYFFNDYFDTSDIK